MITEQDLKQAIAECQGERNPNANTCIKLAAYYTILNHLYGKDEPVFNYSYANAPTAQPANEYINYRGDSDFARVINGKQSDDVFKVMDELMNTLRVLNPRLYDGVMNKLSI